MFWASRLVFSIGMVVLGGLSQACEDSGSCEDIEDEDDCNARQGCRSYSLYSFVRLDGGRFECTFKNPLVQICQEYFDPLVPTLHVCTLYDGNEYIVPAYYQAFMDVYPCEGHENQYSDCINDDVCAYCGNGRQDNCELCDGDLYEPRPCAWELDQGFTGGMITRCNETCDGYDTSDCTTD